MFLVQFEDPSLLLIGFFFFFFCDEISAVISSEAPKQIHGRCAGDRVIGSAWLWLWLGWIVFRDAMLSDACVYLIRFFLLEVQTMSTKSFRYLARQVQGRRILLWV